MVSGLVTGREQGQVLLPVHSLSPQRRGLRYLTRPQSYFSAEASADAREAGRFSEQWETHNHLFSLVKNDAHTA